MIPAIKLPPNAIAAMRGSSPPKVVPISGITGPIRTGGKWRKKHVSGVLLPELPQMLYGQSVLGVRGPFQLKILNNFMKPCRNGMVALHFKYAPVGVATRVHPLTDEHVRLPDGTEAAVDGDTEPAVLHPHERLAIVRDEDRRLQVVPRLQDMSLVRHLFAGFHSLQEMIQKPGHGQSRMQMAHRKGKAVLRNHKIMASLNFQKSVRIFRKYLFVCPQTHLAAGEEARVFLVERVKIERIKVER